MISPHQAYRYDIVAMSLPRSAKGFGTNVAVIRYSGLARCCDRPRRMKLVTNGSATEKCGNCGAEALRE